jgi:hypothetical protein
MKRLLILLVVIVCTTIASAQLNSELSMPPNGDNQRAEVAQWIGPVQVSIAYHSPNVHGVNGVDRTGHIWGELVKYGLFDEGFGPSHATPWRVGANESTTITLSHDAKIDGHDIKAGTYALFLKVEKDGPWTWIFSSNPGWGSFQYDPKYDVLRVDATPKDAPYTEFMTFSFDERKPDCAIAYLQWEKKRVDFKVSVPNVNDIYVAEMRKQLMAWPGFDYQNWAAAAQFCADHKINLDEALTWADKAINEPFRGAVRGHRSFSTLKTKAAVLHAMNRDQESDAVINEALLLPGNDVLEVHSYGVSLLTSGRNDRAMEIFKLNRQQHPDDKFVTYLGLARGYTAIGDKANAIANWELALRNVPEERKALIPTIEGALKKLRSNAGS